MAPKPKHYTKAQLTQFREMLEQRRSELADTVRDYVQEVPDSGLQGATGDPADHASSDYTAELFGVLLEKQAGALEEVEQALVKMNAGDYGICDGCHEPISPKRLKAIPWAKLCLPCQQKQDRISALKRSTASAGAWDMVEDGG
jgi:DnaK suppressor protein